MDGSAGEWRRDGASEVAAPAFVVDHLVLTEFRCYAALRLETGGASVVLAGPNGAGKTNVLEAMSFLVPGRGLRGARLGEVTRRPAADAAPDPARRWAVAARVDGAGPQVALGTGLDTGDDGRERRRVRIDGVDAANQASLAEHLAAVWLTPQMDGLFGDGAGARRRFLDRLVFAADPAHAGRVSAYDQAARQRLKLLADSGAAADPAWLDAIEDTMAARGVAVAAARLETVRALDGHARVGRDPFPGAALAMDGEVEAWLDHGPALAAEERLKAALAESRDADAASGRTGRGAQRSDLVVHHLPKGRPAAECSTGEQKALLIGIVLAYARRRAQAHGRQPVLLLDEIAAHLDGPRREALFEQLRDTGAQVWLTGTDAALFRPFTADARLFHVDDGRVVAS